MTCLTKHLDGMACISCQKTDGVYLGHGQVRFCAYCTLSWDPSEDGSLLKQRNLDKAVIAYEGAEGGELPEDVLGRMGTLIGAINGVMAFERRLQAMMEIPEALFTEEAERQSKASVWQEMTSGFSRVMALVHLSMRMLPVDVDALQKELKQARVVEFEAIVSDFIDLSGCGGKANLQNIKELETIDKQSRLDAEGIANTYNLDLAKILVSIREETPTANRHAYAKQLRDWEAGRSPRKTTQIALHTTMTTRSQALESFVKNNNLKPEAELRPRVAKEPICAGWINRGRVPWAVVEANPSPYHPGCPHYWWPVKFSQADCSGLWMGSE